MKQQILIVEDESSIADNIVFALQQEGYASTWTTLGDEAVKQLQTKQKQFDLVILDVGLPDISGFEVCKLIRQWSDIPIMFLTARGDEVDRVVGLEIGADDYVVKPFSPRELVARVKVILKRMSHQTQPLAPSKLFTVDEDKCQIHFSDVLLALTSYEFGILKTLLHQPERVFSREQLMTAVLGAPEESFDRVIDSHIKTIRAKIRGVDDTYNPIITHRGMGYSIKTSR